MGLIERLIEWMDDPERQPAKVAFTEGTIGHERIINDAPLLHWSEEACSSK